jgi:hypothetical protein
MLPGRSRFESSALRVPALAVLCALCGAGAAQARADHPKAFRTALEGLKANQLGAADRMFLKDASRPCADQLLNLYELASFYHLGGDPLRSMQLFNTADAVARGYEGRALVSAQAVGRGAGAVLLNDSVTQYEGFCYEKIMSRTLNAMNFLLLGDLEGARVEVRKAEEYQRLERERRQGEVQRAAGPEPGAESASLDNPAVAGPYARMLSQVRNVRNSFENAFTYYLSSQIYLAQGEDGLDDALVEIKRAVQLAPQAPAVLAAYQEILRRRDGSAGLVETRDRLRRMAGASGAGALDGPWPAGTGSLVVCYEAGLVPRLEQVKLSLYAQDKLYNLAFPIYHDFGAPQAPLVLEAPGQKVATSTVLETRTLAVKALQERMPGILTRGLLGAIAKGAIQQEAEEKYGPFAGLVGQVASYVFTAADLRSWLSLPAEVQVADCKLQAGRAGVTLRGPGWTQALTLDIAPGSHTFLFVRAFPGFKRIDVKTFPAAGDPGGRPGPFPAPAAPAPSGAPGAPADRAPAAAPNL